MDLAGVPLDALLIELKDRSHAGVMCLTLKGGNRTAIWWGDRTRCLGLASRATHGIHLEESEIDEMDEDDSDEADDSLEAEFPQLGQYL